MQRDLQHCREAAVDYSSRHKTSMFNNIYLSHCISVTMLDRRMVTMDKTMHLSSTVMEVWRLKDNGVTSLTF